MSKREITSFFAPKSKRTRVEKNEENEEINEEEQKEIVEEKVSSVSSDLPSHDESGSNETSQSIEPVKTPRDAPLFDLGTWSELLENEFTKSYFKNLMRYVDHEYSTATVYPPKDQVFTAFTTCNLDQLKVVIIGQDPYHGPNQAHGMAFSVLEGNTPPPSLRNIFKEAKSDVGISQPKHGNLTCWSRQGVFLLNTVLTVRSAEPNSHQNRGWEEFTDAVIRELNKRDRLVFILWGKPAQTKCKSINNKKHCIITSSHPSPLGATKTKEPFIGSRCFSRCNRALQEMGKEPINWEVN